MKAGDTLGTVGGVPIVAPIDGCLRGLTARGARVVTGRGVAAIDPRGDPLRCFGIESRAGAIAQAVSVALASERQPITRLVG